MHEPENKLLALSFLRHAAANRIDEALLLLHPEATWWVAGDPERLRVAGLRPRARIDRLMQGLKRSFAQGLQIQVHGVTAEDDRVAVEAEADGAGANGRPYYNRYHFLFTMREGSIIAIREYMDTLRLYDFSQP